MNVFKKSPVYKQAEQESKTDTEMNTYIKHKRDEFFMAIMKENME